MINNKQLRKEVYALYSGVSVEEFSGKHYDKVRDGIRIVQKDILQGTESDVMRMTTYPSTKKARIINMPIEQVVEIERAALIKLRDYKMKELEKLNQWDNELYLQVKNSSYRALPIGKQALQYIQEQAQKILKEQNEKKESQLIQMVQDTISINEHHRRTPLERLGLNTHMYKTLRKLGVKNAIDIAQYSTEDILGQSQIGEDSVEKLQTKLKELGLSLK